MSGDDRGNVVVSAPGDGAERWARRLDVGWSGVVTGTTARDLEGASGPAEVIAIGIRLGQAKAGVLQLWEGDGTSRATVLLDHHPTAIDVGDLDGDGDLEVVIAERSLAGACEVSAFDNTGAQLWRRFVAFCESAAISVGDIDGDGRAEVAYGDVTLFSAPHVALLGGDGTIRWNHVTYEDSGWIALVDGAIVHGGFAAAERGHVTRRGAAGGDVLWQAFLPGLPDPDAPASYLSGGSWFGAVITDVDGDGTREIAASSLSGAVTLLDGATGAARWTTRLEAADLGRLERHAAGPVAYVPGAAGVPPFLAVAQWNNGRTRASAFALSLDGAIVATHPTEGEAQAIAVARFAPGVTGAAIGAGLGVYALEARGAAR